MSDPALRQRIDAVRRFNRFYTQKIGVLEEGLLKSPFSLTEVRVLYELAHAEGSTAADLAQRLGLDAGYLSRMLQGFQKSGLVAKRPSKTDGRQKRLSLTPRGVKVYGPLDAGASDLVRSVLLTLSAAEQARLVGAMETVQDTLAPKPAAATPFVLRPPRAGDMGWVVQHHGHWYAREYGWDEQFEALIAEIVSLYLRNFDPRRERCWIAERDGQNVGAIFLVKQSKAVGKLRLLWVDPQARGLGIGSRLVSECIQFARDAGYRKITLWTQSVLTAARRIYQSAGFVLVSEEPHHSFGVELVGQTWELTL